MKWLIIGGLDVYYIPYEASIQGWDRQPSMREFEILLSSQKSLARQMTAISESKRDTHFFGKIFFF